MKVFDAAATRAALPFPALIDALRRLFAAGCEVPRRHVHTWGETDGDARVTSLLMPAWTALKADADKALTVDRFSVVDKTTTPPSVTPSLPRIGAAVSSIAIR